MLHFITAFAAVVLCTFVVAEDKTALVTEGLVLEAVPLNSSPVTTGETLDVVIILRNKSGEVYRVNDTWTYKDYDIKATLRDEDNKESDVPISAYLKQRKAEGFGGIGSLTTQIKPGEKIVFVISLSQLFDVCLRGKYTFKIKRLRIGKVDGKELWPRSVMGELEVKIEEKHFTETSPEKIKAKQLSEELKDKKSTSPKEIALPETLTDVEKAKKDKVQKEAVKSAAKGKRDENRMISKGSLHLAARPSLAQAVSAVLNRHINF